METYDQYVQLMRKPFRCVRLHLLSLFLPADDQRALRDTRAQVCEIIAARFVMRLSDADAIEYCLYQLPMFPLEHRKTRRVQNDSSTDDLQLDENSALLAEAQPSKDIPQVFDHRPDWDDGDAQQSIFACSGLTALEVAVIAEAKHFLSRSTVQDIINGIWYGKITFEETGSVEAPIVPKLYDRATDSLVTRLKVPRYRKSFEILFYLGLLALCCAVPSQGHVSGVSGSQNIPGLN